MKPLRIRDIIGPVMVGPSSSHTAGALRIALMAKRLFHRKIASVEFVLYGSFAHTYCGHGTDRALTGGILGFDADDLRIRDSLALAQDAGVEVSFNPQPQLECNHPNTVDVKMTDPSGETMSVRGESIGGGSAVLTRIDDIEVFITGEHNSLIVTQKDVKGVLAHIARCISDQDVNIATTRMFREKRGEKAYTIMETDHTLAPEIQSEIQKHPAIQAVRVIPADEADGENIDAMSDERCFERFEELDFLHASTLLAYCETHGVEIWEAFLAREQALSATMGKKDSTFEYLGEALQVMRESAHSPSETVHPSLGGLIGGEAKKLRFLQENKQGIFGPLMAKITRYALAVLETNASMGRIVAAPTAGSAGVIPAVLLTLQETKDYDDEDLKKALITAAAVGYFISRNATVSGAEGGCQAEIGSAAAMAAAAATQLTGGSPQQCFAAAANSLANLMGLVCDPIGGLVEAPCQKRNASGAATALVSAEIALAGVENLVNFDETVDAMYAVGRAMPFELRETALGGLAVTPSACAFCPGGMSC